MECIQRARCLILLFLVDGFVRAKLGPKLIKGRRFRRVFADATMPWRAILRALGFVVGLDAVTAAIVCFPLFPCCRSRQKAVSCFNYGIIRWYLCVVDLG